MRKLYKFGVTGGSPYDGEVLVLAPSGIEAREKAEERVKKANVEHQVKGEWPYRLLDIVEEPKNLQSGTIILHFDFGDE